MLKINRIKGVRKELPYVKQTVPGSNSSNEGCRCKEAFHYQIAGDKGAVVTEYGVYHQNEGNRFTNPNVKF